MASKELSSLSPCFLWPPQPTSDSLRAMVLGDEQSLGSAQVLLPRRRSIFKRQARNLEVLGVGWEVGV